MEYRTTTQPPHPQLANSVSSETVGSMNDSFFVGEKVSDFANGRYAILLLKRRDLPRRIVNIQDHKFELDLCNKV